MTCQPDYPCFGPAGKCAITFSTYQCRGSNKPWPNVTGNIGSALFPGSLRVLNRASNTLEPCTKQLCPTAAMSSQTKQLVNFAPLYTVYRFHYILADTATVGAMGAAYSFYPSSLLQISPVLGRLRYQKCSGYNSLLQPQPAAQLLPQQTPHRLSTPLRLHPQAQTPLLLQRHPATTRMGSTLGRWLT
jgi:hypothetical protein